MGYIIGILVIAVGFFLIWKTEWFLQNFGRSTWAEQHLSGSGGTRTMYKGMGMILIFVSLLGMSGELGNIILFFIGPLFGL